MAGDPTRERRARLDHVEAVAAEELGWIFLERSRSEVGIDAVLEVVEDGQATGLLIALVIRSAEEAPRLGPEAFAFQGAPGRLDDWGPFGLPILVVLSAPDVPRAWWQIVDTRLIEREGSRWTLAVPTARTFDAIHHGEILDAVADWRADRLPNVVRRYMEPLRGGGGSGDRAPGEDRVALDLVDWGMELLQYYEAAPLPWITTNLFLQALTCSVQAVFRWNPTDPRARLARLVFLPVAIRRCALHVAGIAGMDDRAKSKGLEGTYCYVARPTELARRKLVGIHRMLKAVEDEIGRLRTARLDEKEDAMASQAAFALYEAENTAVFKFVDQPDLKELHMTAHGGVRPGVAERLARARKGLVRRWERELSPPMPMAIEELAGQASPIGPADWPMDDESGG